MAICWYCHWGWAKPVTKIYREALEKLEGWEWPLLHGPAHIVWSDENFYDNDIQWCLTYFDEDPSDYSPEDLEVVRWSLEELLKIPEDERVAEPEEYDGEHPQWFPPKMEVDKVR